MTYEFFKIWCKTMCAKAGGRYRLRFSQEDGKYRAQYDDITISANSESKVFTVLCGSGHCATFPQPEAV